MTTKNQPPLNEMPGEIWAWKPEILYGEYTVSPKEHHAPSIKYIRFDLINKAPQPHDDEDNPADDAEIDFSDLVGEIRCYFDPEPMPDGIKYGIERVYAAIRHDRAERSPPETGEDEG